jgi:lipoprotein-releasing system ATP-binding protein
MSNLPILLLSNIHKTFRQGTESLHILKDAALTIAPGEMVALVGPSGSGKSTLLQIAGLLDNVDQGTVIINHTDCSTASDSQRTLLRRNALGFVYQFHHLLPDFTALENICFPHLIAGMPKKEAVEKSLLLLDRLGLKARAQHRPSELSGGEQQRVAIARAMVHNPVLLLADEPTGNLDPATAEIVFDILVEAAQELNLAALIVTHNLQLAHKMHRRITIKDGAIVEYDE